MIRRVLLLGLTLAVLAIPAAAQDFGEALAALSDALRDEGGEAPASLSGRILQLLAVVTVLSIAPGLLVVMTSFTRFVIVFSMLRSALGLGQTPPNVALTSLALFMTFFVMQPVFEDAWDRGLQPLLTQEIVEEDAVPRIAEPFHRFMSVNTRPIDIQLFAEINESAEPNSEGADAAGWRTLVPAFMISELRRAFTIGFLIYLPFIAIDLIVASVLMSAGMMMLPPVMISLPFKVIFFVLIDGWYMLAGSLMQSYAGL